MADANLERYLQPSLLRDAGYGDLANRVSPDMRSLYDNLDKYVVSSRIAKVLRT